MSYSLATQSEHFSHYINYITQTPNIANPRVSGLRGRGRETCVHTAPRDVLFCYQTEEGEEGEHVLVIRGVLPSVPIIHLPWPDLLLYTLSSVNTGPNYHTEVGIPLIRSANR